MSDDFLARWSRRKRDVAEEAALAEEEVEAAPVAPPDSEEVSEAEVLERLGLPDPDDMAQGDDFSAFMQAAVPEALRRRALRRLWRSNPVLACLDGLNDYDDDFTGDTVAPGELKTLYKVGRGFLRDSGGDAEAAEAAEGSTVASEEDAGAASEDDPFVDHVQESAEPIDNRQESQDVTESGATASRRRMAFHFPDQ